METLKIKSEKGDILKDDPEKKEPRKGTVIRGDETVDHKGQDKNFNPREAKNLPDPEEEDQTDTEYEEEEDNQK